MMKQKEIPWWMIAILFIIVFTGCQPGVKDSKKSDAVIDNNKPQKESKKNQRLLIPGKYGLG